MSAPKKTFYENQANSIISKLKARKMEGYYCPDKESARAKVLELIGTQRKLVTYGGSMSLGEAGIYDAVEAAGHDLLRREKYVTPEEKEECYAKQINADVFLMSTNAITLDGELVNIDGAGSRLAFLLFGPKEVIILTGMNKVVTNVEEGIHRVRNFASPPNTVRLGNDTPCSKTGQCGNCLSDTICCHTVVTRASRIPGRIKVILVGEELGY